MHTGGAATATTLATCNMVVCAGHVRLIASARQEPRDPVVYWSSEAPAPQGGGGP